jgi:signal transduction histidine kinase
VEVSVRDAHGGTIDAHNNTDGGATFSVTLPRTATPEIVSEATGAA